MPIVYLSGIGRPVDYAKFIAKFAEYGFDVSTSIIRVSGGRTYVKFAFVKVESEEIANKMIADLDGKELWEDKLRVEISTQVSEEQFEVMWARRQEIEAKGIEPRHRRTIHVSGLGDLDFETVVAKFAAHAKVQESKRPELREEE
eukprot:g12732.t1